MQYTHRLNRLFLCIHCFGQPDMCSYLSRAQREDVSAQESCLWQRRDYCASWFSSQLLLTSFPGANDKYTLDRLLLNFTGRSHSSVPNRFPTCIPLKGWLGTWYTGTIGIMVKKEKKVFCNVDFKKLGITFKKCKRSTVFRCYSVKWAVYLSVSVWCCKQTYVSVSLACGAI